MSDLEPNCLRQNVRSDLLWNQTVWPGKSFLKKFILKKKSSGNTKYSKLPGMEKVKKTLSIL